MTDFIKYNTGTLPSAEFDLVRRLKAHDENAMTIFYERYSAALYDEILQIVKNHEKAEDILQESLITIWNAFDTYNQKNGNLFIWASSICRNISSRTHFRQDYLKHESDIGIDNLEAFQVPKSSNINSIQVSLLHMFERGMSEEETLQLKRLMVKSYLEIMRQEAGRIDEERGYTAEDYERMLNEPS